VAKSKAELLKDAQAAGLVAADVAEDDVQVDDLKRALNPDDAPAWKGSLSASSEIVAPDGHVVLSKEDISARSE
jgi:hypothetical protein